MKLRLYQLVKMMIGFIIGMLIAMLFKLPYFFTAGVIVVLSLEPTRKASLELGIVRIIDSALSLGLAVLLFYLFGFHIWVLFVFIALFVPISFAFKLEKGIVVSLVLVSQIYLEQSIKFALNASYIMLIGVGIAFLLNLYMPTNKNLLNKIKEIDKAIDNIIQKIANQEEFSFDSPDKLINQTYIELEIELENVNLPLITDQLKYLEMRKEQISVLKRINQILISVTMIPEKQIILDFLKNFENQIGEDNFALSLLDELNELIEKFRKSALPKNREAFENRAQLYYVLIEINQFLTLKMLYHESNEK